MIPSSFQTCPDILFAPGATARTAGVVGECGAGGVLLVTDAGMRGAG